MVTSPKLAQVHLCLLGGKGTQSQKDLSGGGTHSGYESAQRDDASGVAALANHLEDPSGAQFRILLEDLANKLLVGFGQAGTSLLFCGGSKTLRSDGSAHGVVVNAQFCGNRPDFPVFGIKEATNLSFQFRGDHRSPPMEGVDPAADATATNTNRGKIGLVRQRLLCMTVLLIHGSNPSQR